MARLIRSLSQLHYLKREQNWSLNFKANKQLNAKIVLLFLSQAWRQLLAQWNLWVLALLHWA